MYSKFLCGSWSKIRIQRFFLFLWIIHFGINFVFFWFFVLQQTSKENLVTVSLNSTCLTQVKKKSVILWYEKQNLPVSLNPGRGLISLFHYCFNLNTVGFAHPGITNRTHLFIFFTVQCLILSTVRKQRYGVMGTLRVRFRCMHLWGLECYKSCF